MKKITVSLAGRSYPILIGRKLLPSVGRWVKPLGVGPKVLIVSNRRVAGLFLRTVRASLARAGFEVVKPYLLPHGDERDKSSRALVRLWTHMAAEKMERSSAVLALGGGVVGDLAGFAASTYMRGIPVVQVPTTLLAQVDAAIGGKAAIDLPSAKNIVGAFHQPCLVVADVDTLAPSGIRELRNGFAEVIKYGVIRDPALFRLLERKARGFFSSASKGPLGNQELSFLETVVRRSARVKAEIVARDEREIQGERLILNYGHTFAHGLEAASGYRLPHGEAVAIGMTAAARLARRLGLLAERAEIRQRELLHAVGLPTRLPRSLRPEDVIRPMQLDKKKKRGKLHFILPKKIGRAFVAGRIPQGLARRVLSELRERS